MSWYKVVAFWCLFYNVSEDEFDRCSLSSIFAATFFLYLVVVVGNLFRFCFLNTKNSTIG